MIRLFCVFMLIFSCSKPDDSPAPSPSMPSPVPSESPDVEPVEYALVKGPAGKVYHTGLRAELKGQRKLGVTHARFKADDCKNLPDEFDLRKLGVVSPVRNQGGCGSCWSFSKTGSLESALLVAGKGQFDLSEQELVSCDRNNYGCGGGNLNGDSEYQVRVGQALENDFPYTGRNSRCKSDLKPVAKGVNWVFVGESGRSPTEEEVKCALFKSHTVPWITADASNWGSPPSSENTMFSRCGGRSTNHAIGVVGWKKIGGKTGFIMKNSWGTDWGDNGYMTLPLGCTNFGEEVAFIQIDAPPPSPTPTPTPTPTPPGPTPTPVPPGPCKLPIVRLPAQVVIEKGVEVMLGARPEAGVYYQWYASGIMVATGSILYASPEADTIYKLQASNSCGASESSVQVKINPAK
jgi:hypothetical protein